MNSPRRLLFVYNADSGLFNLVTDMAHKLLSPETYACQLCALTHTPLAMRTEWRSFLAGLGTECRFLHRDEWARQYPGMAIALPAVLWESADGVAVCLDAARIRECDSLETLKGLIAARCLCGEKADHGAYGEKTEGAEKE